MAREKKDRSAGSDAAAKAPKARKSRRLSPWRVSLAVLVTAGVAAGGFLGVHQWASARADVVAEPWYAGYVDVTATPTYAFEGAGSADAVLAFIVSSKTDACTPSWGAAYTMDEASDSLDLDRRIARLQQSGGSVAISFGGQANSELAIGCDDTDKLQAAYASVLDRYKVGTIDLDLEGGGLTDQAAAERRATAIAALQAERRASGDPLAVWVTLPVATSGMTSDGTDAIATLLAAGVDLAGVNLMTMDYGTELSSTMAAASESALTEGERQLGILYKQAGINLSDATLWSKIGATPMIGQNDVKGEVFTLADAAELNEWATAKGVGRMSMWSANRDQTCGDNYPTLTVVSDACSGVNQGGKTYTAALSKNFDGGLALGEETVTTSEPTDAAELVDDPATSPYAIWSEDASYVAGTKIVWHRNVYVAKWWTKGDTPDDPVLSSYETPWTLVGPVLPGETPIPQPTLAAGTYDDWNGATVYEKGDRILFDGVPYEAKWWTQGDSPEAASADPDSSPWSALTAEEIVKVQAAG